MRIANCKVFNAGVKPGGSRLLLNLPDLQFALALFRFRVDLDWTYLWQSFNPLPQARDNRYLACGNGLNERDSTFLNLRSSRSTINPKSDKSLCILQFSICNLHFRPRGQIRDRFARDFSGKLLPTLSHPNVTRSNG